MSAYIQPTAPEPLVSVIIPCYNGEQFVGAAIESALTQTYPHKEVIVIDDGSIDRSVDIIRSFGRRVRWESGRNSGACAARNRGLTLANGEFVQFLDADDVLLPDKLELQVAHSAETSVDEVSICLGRTENGDPYLDWQYGRLLTGDRDPVDFVLGGILSTTAPLHRRSFLVRIGGFDPSLPCAQEFDLHLRLVCAGIRLSQLAERLFVVRRRSGSISADGLKVTRQKFYILGKATELLRARDALTPHRSRRLGVAYAKAALALDLGGFADEAVRCTREATALCPDAQILAWTPKWRPVVRLLGGSRAARARRRIRRLLGKTP